MYHQEWCWARTERMERTGTLSSLSSSQIRFQYQSFRIHLTRNRYRNWTVRTKNEKDANNSLKVLYCNPGIE